MKLVKYFVQSKKNADTSLRRNNDAPEILEGIMAPNYWQDRSEKLRQRVMDQRKEIGDFAAKQSEIKKMEIDVSYHSFNDVFQVAILRNVQQKEGK